MQHNKKKNKSLQYNKLECKIKSIKYFKKILGGKKTLFVFGRNICNLPM